MRATNLSGPPGANVSERLLGVITGANLSLLPQWASLLQTALAQLSLTASAFGCRRPVARR
jgi:hypothetical protein